MCCVSHGLWWDKQSISMGNSASWIRKSVCHSLPANLVWPSHARQKSDPEVFFFHFPFPSSVRLRLLSLEQMFQQPTQSTPWRQPWHPCQRRHACPKTMLTEAARDYHLPVTETWVSVLDMTFFQHGEVGKYFLRNKKKSQECYALCLMANPCILSKVCFILQEECPKLAKPKVRIESKQSHLHIMSFNFLKQKKRNAFSISPEFDFQPIQHHKNT